MEYDNPKQVYEEYISGSLTHNQAAELINEIVGGITKVSLKNNKKFTITNHIQTYSLPYGKHTSKEEKKKSLALLNALNDYTNGRTEAHLGKGFSSKHYKQGLKNVLDMAG